MYFEKNILLSTKNTSLNIENSMENEVYQNFETKV